jgi:PAS domain-containing protein
MPILELLEKSPVTVGAIVALTPLLLPRVRALVAASGQKLLKPFRNQDTLMVEVGLVRKMVESIQYQVQTNNGGSLKDVVIRTELGQQKLAQGLAKLESYRMHDFWTRTRAGMEIDAAGHVILASEATCKLFGVSDPDELMHLSWVRFLDPHHVDVFLRTFRETAASGSIFRFAIRIRDNSNVDRGEWEFRATPIGNSEPRLYSGLFAPFDPISKELAGRNGWS